MKLKGMVWPSDQGAGLSQEKHCEVWPGLNSYLLSIISGTRSTTRYLPHRPHRPHRGPKHVTRLSVRCPKNHL